MNAERGHANIQGNTDHAISWEILPGYLRIPAPGQKNLNDYVQQSAPKKFDANSWNFFGTNYRNFMVSLLKGWYGDAATAENEYAFEFVPKPASNASWISIYDQALKGKMEGVILSGMTATSIGPDSNQVMEALGKLKWLVIMDPLPTTSSEFWHRPGVDPKTVQTEVFMVPTTHWIEKDGSFVNSGRWMQWKDQVIPPDGQARHDHWVLADVYQRVKKLYQQHGGKFPEPLMALTLKYKDPAKPELDEIAQEINGFDLSTGKRLDSFAKLKDDGTTTAGDWIYTGSYPESGNLSKRRNGIQDPAKNDPTGMGYYHGWAWSWPLNRRVMYNRASADLDGKPWDPSRPGIAWNEAEKKWAGDVPDYPATMDPKSPKAWGPFIMNGEGVGRLFSSSMLDGPFPEHYEPMEAPIPNPLHPNQSESPVAFLYDKAAGRDRPFGTVKDYPYVATSYRLTEHEHYVTQHVPHLVGLQPAPFVEVPEELAREKGIQNGDRVRVSSKRGKLEVAAIVTKRLGPVQVRRQEGLPDRHPDPLGLRRHRCRPRPDEGSELAGQRPHAVRGGRQLADARVQGVPGQHREGLMHAAAADRRQDGLDGASPARVRARRAVSPCRPAARTLRGAAGGSGARVPRCARHEAGGRAAAGLRGRACAAAGRRLQRGSRPARRWRRRRSTGGGEAGGAELVVAWLRDEEQDPVSRYLARAAAGPVLEALGRDAGLEPGDRPRGGGARPAAVCRRCRTSAMPGESLVTGPRYLVCSRCHHTWVFARMTCAGCGEHSGSKLPIYGETERFPHLRVDACDSCGGYLLTVDLGKAPGAVPIVDELAAVPLDLYARDQGKRKIVPNLMGM